MSDYVKPITPQFPERKIIPDIILMDTETKRPLKIQKIEALPDGSFVVYTDKTLVPMKVKID